jgi:hypothetical protein
MVPLRSWNYFVHRPVLGISSLRRLEIFFDVRVRKAAIVHVDTQLRRGNGATRKKDADRFKDGLMLRLDERARAERLQESLPVFARGRLIAQQAEGLEFGYELCFAIHGNGGS